VADFHSSGWGASGTGGFLGSRTPDLPTVGGPQDAEAFVAARVKEGSEYIKLFVQDPSTSGLPEMSEATIAAVATAARRRHLHSIAHAPYRWPFDTAHDANVSIITHVPLDDAIDRQWARRAAARKQIFMPTLVMSKAQVESQGSSSPCCVSPSAPTGSGGMTAVPGLSYDNARNSVSALHAVGLPILVGTDSHAPGAGISGPASVPFGSSIHTELALLVDAGLSPVQALRAATALNASLFRLADRGRVKSGFQADLLLVTGDPTSDITATKAIAQVWRRGAPLKKSDGS
jgi:imidazolonepropionase-like amidohydrolase